MKQRVSGRVSGQSRYKGPEVGAYLGGGGVGGAQQKARVGTRQGMRPHEGVWGFAE